MEKYYYYNTDKYGILKITYDKGLCELKFMKYDTLINPQNTLEKSLNTQAPLKKQPALLQTIVKQLDQYFKGHRQTFTIPLTPQGTKFQQRVWKATCAIPYANVVSYQTLSEQLHTSPRAIGQALNKNPILIVIPCHRVVMKSKDLGGYSAGKDLKKNLIHDEFDKFLSKLNT